MSLQNEQNDFESCLASLDSPVNLIHLNYRSQSPSPSSKSIVLGSPRSRSDSFRRPYARSPLGELSSADNNKLPTRARSSSRASSIIIGHESRYSVRPSILNSFQALPPILSGSSVHFRSNLDFNFQSFMISSGNVRARRPSRLSERPPALPPLPSLSQPLFPPAAETQKDLFQIPSLRHPNSPYVPWDSPMRRQIFRPLTPEPSSESLSSFSEISRSGARAPEPTELSEHGLKLVKVSQGISKMHRKVKHVAGVAKRMFTRQRHVVEVSPVPPHLSINPHVVSDNSLVAPAYPPSPGVASFDSSNTRSLALWLESRHQETWDTDSRHFMSLEDYERRGSWINLAGGKVFVCSNPSCIIHSNHSHALADIDARAMELDQLDEHNSEQTAESENPLDVEMEDSSRTTVDSSVFASQK